MNLSMSVHNPARFILISKHTGLQCYSFSHLSPWEFWENGWENKTKRCRVLIQQNCCSASPAVIWKHHAPILFCRSINKANGETVQPNYIWCETSRQQSISVLPENYSLWIIYFLCSSVLFDILLVALNPENTLKNSKYNFMYHCANANL